MTAGGFAAGTLSCTCGNQKHLPDAQQIAGKSVQASDGVYGGVIPSGKQPEGIAGLNLIADRTGFRSGGGDVLADAKVGLVQGVPGGFAYDAVGRKILCPLESKYGLPGAAAEDAVLRKRRDAGIIFGDHI